MNKFKKFFCSIAGVVVCAAMAMTTVGCKSIPTDDQMYRTSYAIGVATGMVAGETKIDDVTRNAVCDIVNIVAYCVPETNETFEAAWMPKAQAHIAKLVEEGKLDPVQARMVETVFSVVVQGIDYVFEYRFPKAKTYKELVSAAVGGFSDGFLLVFKPADGFFSTRYAERFDLDAYRWIKSNRK